MDRIRAINLRIDILHSMIWIHRHFPAGAYKQPEGQRCTCGAPPYASSYENQSRGCLRSLENAVYGIRKSSILLLALVGQADIVTVLVTVTVAGTAVEGFEVLVASLADVVAGLLELVDALLVEVAGLLVEEATLLEDATTLLAEVTSLLVETAALLVDDDMTAFDVDDDVDVTAVTKMSL